MLTVLHALAHLCVDGASNAMFSRPSWYTALAATPNPLGFIHLDLDG